MKTLTPYYVFYHRQGLLLITQYNIFVTLFVKSKSYKVLINNVVNAKPSKAIANVLVNITTQL